MGVLKSSAEKRILNSEQNTRFADSAVSCNILRSEAGNYTGGSRKTN